MPTQQFFSYIMARTILFSMKRRIGCVMVSVFASVQYIVGLSPDRVKPNIIKLVFVASPPSMQH
jgi:hypothetical protein